MRLTIAILVGAALGVIGGRYLFVGSWMSLVPWSLAGLAIGYWSRPAPWLRLGLAYGFTLLFAFMIAGYSGTAPLLGRTPFFAVIGLAGAVYGAALTLVGWALRRKVRPA
ncbi:MAG TPA: hypothetical protein VFI39_05750 [Gemmatimonadales bacterium]|nr:hypothetical protein [Gemmatimonadales bacterium]